MEDFQFTFAWNEADYTANSHVIEGDPKMYIVTVDDPALQTRFGSRLEFKEAAGGFFSWDTPELEGASGYARAVNLGLIEYLDEQE